MLNELYVKIKWNGRWIICKIFFTFGIHFMYLDKLSDGWQPVKDSVLVDKLLTYAWNIWDL